MANSLPAQVTQAVGQPASVRIGTIVQESPLIVSLQGKNLDPAAVGVAFPFYPMIGATVTLLGQSKTQGSDPSSWLIIGMQTGSSTLSSPRFDIEGTDENITSLTYVVGTATCGVTFVAPPSGLVRVDWHARFESTTIAIRSLVSVAVAEGGVLNAGTVVSAAGDGSALETSTDSTGGGSLTRLEAAMFRPVDGLTAGETYNAVVKMRVTAAGTMAVFDRSIMVTPL